MSGSPTFDTGKNPRNGATHGVVLVISVERMTSAIATSARITSAYFSREKQLGILLSLSKIARAHFLNLFFFFEQ